MTRRRKNLVALSAAALVLIAALVAARWYAIDVVGESDLHVLRVLLMKRFYLAPIDDDATTDRHAAMATDVHSERAITLDKRFKPFRQIGATLGPRAAGDQIFRTRGAVIADFNGDGKMDLFLPQAGQTVGTVTDKNVLTQKPLPQKPCVLYLNQGNDADGNPILVAIQDLEARGNQKNVRAELMIENKYVPRRSLADDEFAIGRMSTGAVAADFNGDGRLDLWVTDDLAGLPFTTEETALRGYPAQRNIGRDEKKRAISIRLPQFLRKPLVDGRNVRVDHAGKPEWEGRDSLFLNLGDSDGDGIPEWKDVTDEAGVGGRWASFSVAVADIDLDGDLDVLVSNYQDPDFYGFGMRRFGGNQMELYINQLAETGKLTFKSAAREWHVSGLIEDEALKATMYFPSSGRDEPIYEQVVDGKPAGEKADHAWSAIFVDQNLDGYPDLVVSTDEGDRLRVYTNDHGRQFVRDKRFDEDKWEGCWMGMAAGDLDGDGKEELFVSNCGGQSMSASNMALLNKERGDESILALAPLNYAMDRARLANVILTARTGTAGWDDISDLVRVHHSPYIAPDLTRRENFAPSAIKLYDEHNYAHGLAAYEFAYASVMLDVENDGDLDIYWAGALARGNDGFIGDWTNSPGRLLVNDTPAAARGKPEKIELTDRTLEYRLLDITDMDYDHNPPRRRSPGTNWHKRDYINIEDMDSYSEAGVAASQQSLIHDLFFMHEAANGIATGDLNGDGFDDLVVTHFGGYNSLSPTTGNLKADVGGMVLAIPAPNKVMKPPTGFEEGATFLYVNQNAGTNHWLKLRLSDDHSLNRFAIGARITAYGPLVSATRVIRAGGSTGSANSTDVIIGLGRDGLASAIDIEWPNKQHAPQHYSLPMLRDHLVCIERQRGVIPCNP
ncbi:MAG: hypothetical protein JWN44_1047 [Myxococcales bacterium]|nr:hypothetical protein [Myxococcales bacterium]